MEVFVEDVVPNIVDLRSATNGEPQELGGLPLSETNALMNCLERHSPGNVSDPHVSLGTATQHTQRGKEVEEEPADNDKGNIQRSVALLVKDMQSKSVIVQRSAATKLRFLAKDSLDNRVLIASYGAIKPLIALLDSADTLTQENAVTALLNLSINDSNKSEIAASGAIDALVNVLKAGNLEAKENAAATLYSLSMRDENKLPIGQSGVVPPLIDLLKHGSTRGKKDSVSALLNLSLCHENKARIVEAGAIKPLVALITDPAAGMVDKSATVLTNLASIPEGKRRIGEDGGIPALVEVVELGSQKGKEQAVAALLRLCTNSRRFQAMVLQEGAIPPLFALSRSGTPRAQEKASTLLRHLTSMFSSSQRRQERRTY